MFLFVEHWTTQFDGDTVIEADPRRPDPEIPEMLTCLALPCLALSMLRFNARP